MKTYTTKTSVVFEDFDTTTHKTVFKTFPVGTLVKDVLRPSNPNQFRLVAPVGVIGFIASIHVKNLA